MAEPASPPSLVQALSLRFRLGPFPVVVEPTFWFLGLVGFGASWLSVAWVAVAFVSVLVHELGHALAARRFGSSASIRLYALGGLTFHEHLPNRTHRILISFAGPAAGFVLGLLVLAVHFLLPPEYERPPALAFVVDALLYINFTWGVVNLLPVPPLDGGHVFEEAVGPRRKLLAAQVGAFAGAAAAVEAFRRWNSLFATLMFGFLAFRCVATWIRLASDRRVARQLQRTREAMWEDALAEDQVGEAHRAALRETLRTLRDPSPGPAPEPEPDLNPALLARVFEELGSPRVAADRALEAHRRDPSDASALQAVRLLVAAGQRPEAEALVARTRWSAEATRAEAAALLASPSPTRSRG
jgi:Zn-dependent protease